MRNKSDLRHSATMTIQALIMRALGMVSSLIIVRVLTIANFGVYSAFLSTASSAYGVVRLGIDGAIHVETASSEGGSANQSEILSTGMVLLAVIGTLGTAVMTVGAPIMASRVFGHVELTPYLRCSAALVLLQCVSQYCYAALAGLHRFNQYTAATVIGAIVSLVLTAAAAWLWGLSGAVAANVLATASTTFLLAKALRAAANDSGLQVRFRASLPQAQRLLAIGLPLYIAGLVAIPVNLWLQGLLSTTSGMESLARLRVVLVFTSLVALIPTSIAAVTISSLARARGASEQENEEFLAIALQRVRVLWGFALIVALGLQACLPVVVPLLFGEDYRIVVRPASVGLISAALTVVLGVVGQITYARGKAVWVILQTCAIVLPTALAGIALIPGAGLDGYVLAELVGVGVASIGLLGWSALRWRRHPSYGGIAILGGCTVAMVVETTTANRLELPDTLRTAATLALLLLAIIAYALRVLRTDERSRMMSALRTRLRH